MHSVSVVATVAPEQALERAGSRALLSHESAARALGIELLEPGADRLIVPRSRSRLSIPGWTVVRADVSSADRHDVEGLPCTAPVRTLADLGRTLPHVEAVVAVDNALRAALVQEAEVTLRLSSAWGRGAAAARAVAQAIDPLAGSVLESLLRVLLAGAGLRPVSQHVIRDRHGGFVARVDFCWPEARLVVEADGFAFHADRAAYRRDRERLNDLERLGWRVLRFTWEDVRSRPDHVIATVLACLTPLAA